MWTPRKGFFNLSFYFFPQGDDVQRLEKTLSGKSSFKEEASETGEKFEQGEYPDDVGLEIETASIMCFR